MLVNYLNINEKAIRESEARDEKEPHDVMVTFDEDDEDGRLNPKVEVEGVPQELVWEVFRLGGGREGNNDNFEEWATEEKAKELIVGAIRKGIDIIKDKRFTTEKNDHPLKGISSHTDTQQPWLWVSCKDGRRELFKPDVWEKMIKICS